MTTGAINLAKLQSNHHHQQTNSQFFTGRMPFLSPNQQCLSTEEKRVFIMLCIYVSCNLFAVAGRGSVEKKSKSAAKRSISSSSSSNDSSSSSSQDEENKSDEDSESDDEKPQQQPGILSSYAFHFSQVCSTTVVNQSLITDPIICPPGFNLPRRLWSTLNRFRTGQGRCAANLVR